MNPAPDRPTSGASAAELGQQLREARFRTRRLVEDLTPAQMTDAKLDHAGPLLWQIGSIAWFHERWTLRHCHGDAPIRADADTLWDLEAVPPEARGTLALPDREATFGYLDEVLTRQLDRLAAANDMGAAAHFYDLAIRHEDIHVEALATARQTLAYAPPDLGDEPLRGAGALSGDAEIPGGTWRLGSTAEDGFIFDNEKWAHDVALVPFRMALAPVTNLEFAEFVADDGYRRRDLWSEAGWAWREAARAERPLYWIEESGGYAWRRYDVVDALAPDAPVVFVNFHEAEAWCRWAKRRLPTEAEWEAAALGEPAAEGNGLAATKRRWPWGDDAPARFRANLDFAYDRPLDVAAHPAGDSAFGCRQMIGNVWEWTSSELRPFAGYEPDPEARHARPWFGAGKVLRGGCFATSARVARPGYRHFLAPERRDAVAGFRTCAL